MSTMEKVTLTLPKTIMSEVRKMASPRGYSKFIAEAIEYFIEAKRRQTLRSRLIVGYQGNKVADAEIAAEWASVEDETWLTHVPAYDEEESTDDSSN